jgi:hypothetical protein
MSIHRLLNGSGLGPEEIERLNRAYTYALGSLHLVDRNDPVADIVGRKIIEVGMTGISDPEQISKTAIEQLGVPDYRAGPSKAQRHRPGLSQSKSGSSRRADSGG